MNDFVALDLASAGMRAQRQRMAVIAENLANQHTIGPNGPYQRKEVVFQASPLNDFDQSLQAALDKAASGSSDKLQTVGVAEVRNDNSPPDRRYEPNNPLADVQGYVVGGTVAAAGAVVPVTPRERSQHPELFYHTGMFRLEAFATLARAEKTHAGRFQKALDRVRSEASATA